MLSRFRHARKKKTMKPDIRQISVTYSDKTYTLRRREELILQDGRSSHVKDLSEDDQAELSWVLNDASDLLRSASQDITVSLAEDLK